MNQEHHNLNGAAIQAAHPSVFALPLGAHRVYAALCALLPLDEATDITQERIASFARVSESTVSRSMPLLAAHGLVERRPAEVGAGFVLRLLPLPASTAEADASTAEVVTASSTAEPAPSTVEPALQATVALRIEAPAEQDPQRNESACMVDHDLDQQQQQQQARAAESPLRTISPRVWADMLRGTPGYDQMQFRQDLATLNRRGVGFANAVGIIVSARRAGEMIYGADQVEAQAGGQHNLPVQPAPSARRPAQGSRGGSSRKSGMVRPPTLPPNHGRQFHGDSGGEA